jgi:hypothetical protein
MPRAARLSAAFAAFLALLAAVPAPPAGAEPTHVTVRVLARDAKFVGTAMGGVRITLTDTATGQVLAQGLTAGGTGDTDRIMRRPRARGEALSSGDAAAFSATLDLAEPRRVRVTAEGPAGHPGSAVRVSAEQWVVPGKDLTGGDGWLLELPGFVVDVVAPAPGAHVAGLPARVTLDAKVTMMCGCPIEPGGLWDADRYEVRALVRRDGTPAGKVPLAYAGTTSRFSGSLRVAAPGAYEALIYAYDPATGNTGVARAVFTAGP